MNILFLLGKYPDDGGVAKVTTVLAEGLRGRGHNVYISSFVQNDNNKGTERQSSIQELLLSMPVGSNNNVTFLKCYIEDNRIDAIVCQWAVDFRVSRLCRRAVKGTNCKIITVLHTSPGKTGAIQRITDKINSGASSIGHLIERSKKCLLVFIAKLSLRLTYHYSDCFLTLSPKLKEEVQDFLRIKNAKKLGYIFNPITIDTEEEEIKKENSILYVGRLDNITKRVDRVLNVWKILRDKTNGWSLTLVGDGPDKADLEEYVKKNRLGNVFFAGYTDPKPFYSSSKIVLLTSGYEGFPLILGEAMSYGVIPVVLGSFVAASDIIDNGQNGVIVNMPFETKKFAYTLQTLMGNNQKMDAMSQEAIAKSQIFKLSTILTEWENLLNCFKLSIN